MYDFLVGVGNPCPLKSDLVPGPKNGCCGLSPCLVVDEGSLLSIVTLSCNKCRLDCLCRAGISHLQ
jgi:hypothetical protein